MQLTYEIEKKNLQPIKWLNYNGTKKSVVYLSV